MSSFNHLSFTLTYQITIPFIPMAFLLVKVCVLMACHLHPILCTWDALPTAPVDSCHRFVSTWKKNLWCKIRSDEWSMRLYSLQQIITLVWVPILAIWGRLLYLYCNVWKFLSGTNHFTLVIRLDWVIFRITFCYTDLHACGNFINWYCDYCLKIVPPSLAANSPAHCS